MSDGLLYSCLVYVLCNWGEYVFLPDGAEIVHSRLTVAGLMVPALLTLMMGRPGGASLAVGVRASQATYTTVWDGVYTTDQAARGEAAYDNHCSSCHLPDLRGSAEARPLAGDAFMLDWREDNLNSLFTRIRTLMPFDDPATLGESTYLDSVAYILQVNGFPAGSRELTVGSLAEVRIEARDGPGQVPSFALVRVVGCLTRAADNSWVLNQSTAAVRTNDPSGSSDGELSRLAAQPLGTRSFALMSVYPDPTPHAGHMMEAKGFLVRGTDGAADSVNVSTLGMISTTCGL